MDFPKTPNVTDKGPDQPVNQGESEVMAVITAAFSGMTGGGIVGSFLGVPGVIGGGVIGAIISGLAEHVHAKKHELTTQR